MKILSTIILIFIIITISSCRQSETDKQIGGKAESAVQIDDTSAVDTSITNLKQSAEELKKDADELKKEIDELLED